MPSAPPNALVSTYCYLIWCFNYCGRHYNGCIVISIYKLSKLKTFLYFQPKIAICSQCKFRLMAVSVTRTKCRMCNKRITRFITCCDTLHEVCWIRLNWTITWLDWSWLHTAGRRYEAKPNCTVMHDQLTSTAYCGSKLNRASQRTRPCPWWVGMEWVA